MSGTPPGAPHWDAVDMSFERHDGWLRPGSACGRHPEVAVRARVAERAQKGMMQAGRSAVAMCSRLLPKLPGRPLRSRSSNVT
jgi:hypothetical protein